MNKPLGAWLLVSIAFLVSSVLLFIDSQSPQGILNTVQKPAESPADSARQTISPAIPDEPEPAVKPQEKTKGNSAATTAAELVPAASEPKTAALSKEKPFLVVIDPGHQAKANLEQELIGPGASKTKYKVTGGTTGVVTKKPEYELNLEASFLLEAELEKRGMKVILTRTVNEVDLSNRERAQIANENQADLFVRIHADGSENSATSGFSVLVPAKENPYTAAVFHDSEAAAKKVIGAVSPQFPLHKPGIFYREDMTGFNWSKVPVILPEIGFMTNPRDDRQLSDPSFLKKLMEALANGIGQFAQTKKEVSH